MTAQAKTHEVDDRRMPAEAELNAWQAGERGEARRQAVPPQRAREIERLREAWRAALTPSNIGPPREDLVLGSVCRSGHSAALVGAAGADELEILKTGRIFEAWINHPSRHMRITKRSTGRARALQDVVARALRDGGPAETVAHAVVDGFVCSYALLALPLSNPWGPPRCLVYMQEQDRKYSLVDAMFAATNEGLVALAVIRDSMNVASDFQIVALNNGAARLMTQSVEDLRGLRLSEVFVDLGRRGPLSRLFCVVDSGESAQFELDHAFGSGDKVHLSVNASAMGDLVAVTLTDISDLKAREASFRLFFEGSPMPTVLCDPSGLEFLAANNAAAALWGFRREALLAMTAYDVIFREDWNKVLERGTSGGASLVSGQLLRHVRADGSLIDVVVYSRFVVFQDRPAQLVTFLDVTEKRQTEVRIAHMAHHDALTDLPNRVLFRERLDEALPRVRRQEESVAVFYLDLDQFKSVNDTLGHSIGDRLLQAVADRLRACLREADVVARFGGDEFAIIQTGLKGPDEASRFAAHLVNVVSRPYEIEGHHVEIGTSIGIAMAPGDGDESDLLLKNADMALYRAKEEGRRAFRFFEPEMDARVRARRLLELDLRRALVAGEFELYYQPLVSLKSGAITGFEALLRWHHPARGLVPPAEFIPISEEIGLIAPLGEWVLRQACAEAMNWPGDLKVAVNLSPVQFKSGDLTHVVLTALASSGLPASRLELEITESVLLAESQANLATLHRLRGLGVSVSMDDFGTGYSSLSYLRAFAFDKIKIDQSFIRELSVSGDCMAIVRAVTTLGSSLGISTTAEGVETTEQLEWLRNEGCTEMQGYFFSPPVPASKIGAMLEGNGRIQPGFAQLVDG